jgi:hypothetical protein
VSLRRSVGPRISYAAHLHFKCDLRNIEQSLACPPGDPHTAGGRILPSNFRDTMDLSQIGRVVWSLAAEQPSGSLNPGSLSDHRRHSTSEP